MTSPYYNPPDRPKPKTGLYVAIGVLWVLSCVASWFIGMMMGSLLMMVPEEQPMAPASAVHADGGGGSW